MKLKFTLFITLIIVIAIIGCELVTQPTVSSKTATGEDLIINEIFTLPPNEFNAYSWIEVFNPTTSSIPWFASSNPVGGWLAGSGGTLCWTAQTGTSWKSYTTPVVPKFNSISYFNADTVFAVGDNGNVYRSNDSGRTWFTAAPTVTTNNLNNLTLINVFDATSPNGKLIWACGDNGTFLRSIDRGRSFKSMPTGKQQNLRSIFYVDIKDLFLCGDSLIMRSSDGGQKFVTSVLPSIKEKEIFNSLSFLSMYEGRVVGSHGTVMYTNTQGGVWKPETTNVTANLNSIAYLYGEGWQKAWAVGDNGTIIRADSAGPAYWQVLKSGTTANLHYVNFIDSSRGLVCGDGGVVLTTTNSGRTWHPQTSGTTANLYCGSFLPSFTEEISAYALQVYAERKHIYTEKGEFGQYTLINPDFITKIDTGYIFMQAQDYSLKIKSGGFFVFVSDSSKFNDHTQVGPSEPVIFMADIAAITTLEGDSLQYSLAKWNLLTSSEVRLVKVYQEILLSTGQTIGYSALPIDIVRFGGFKLAYDYPNNKPAPTIPEWWSLARYQDLTTSNLNTMSSEKYFYLCSKPIPGWVSQLRSH